MNSIGITIAILVFLMFFADFCYTSESPITTQKLLIAMANALICEIITVVLCLAVAAVLFL